MVDEHSMAQTGNKRGRVMRLFSQEYLGDILDFCAEVDWIEREFIINKKKTFDFASKQYGFAGSLCVKGLKLVTNVIRMLPDGMKVKNEVLDEIMAKLEIMVNKKFLNIKKELSGDKKLNFHVKQNRHATYLILKLLNTLLEKFPGYQHKITVKLLQSLSKQIKIYKNANQHKKMLKMAIKLA
jgi:hypothetical protein